MVTHSHERDTYLISREGSQIIELPPDLSQLVIQSIHNLLMSRFFLGHGPAERH